jgi:hypothetical protein
MQNVSLFKHWSEKSDGGESYKKESLHIDVKKKYGLNDYFANSAVREAKALFSSRMELNDLYIRQTDEKMKDIKKKLKTERTKLTKLRKIKESCIKGTYCFRRIGISHCTRVALCPLI